MAFIFTNMRSTPAVRRRDMQAARSLPVISEDGPDVGISAPPPVQTRSPALKHPWMSTPNESPLSYSSLSSDASGETDQEKQRQLLAFRNTKQIAKRGGWKRLALWTTIISMCVAGLIAGLVVGLRNRNNNNNSDNSQSTSLSDTAFPAGSYAITTYLSIINTNCTSNPSTWRCYPYITRNDSPSLSSATFSWIITALTTNPPTYTISSTQNPFSILFSNSIMTLQDASLPTEHYTFRVPMTKPVIPSSPITTSNVATTCYFNNTVLSASLYTKLPKSYPASSNSTTMGSAGGGQGSTGEPVFAPWPYAASVEQVATGGDDVPECFDMQGNRVGSFAAETTGECDCRYQNYET